MGSLRIQDRAYYGLGIAARHVGETTDAYRPSCASYPLSKKNRFLRLPAAFLPKSGDTKQTNSYGIAEWYGIFDASYTKPGDYLVVGNRTFFVAAQDPLLPVLCVLTNCTISITRPDMQISTALNPYGGYQSTAASSVMEGWPASVLGITGRGEPAARLPTDQTVPHLAILLPAWPSTLISPGDLISDDLGRSATVTSSELTELGWRLCAKMATT